MSTGHPTTFFSPTFFSPTTPYDPSMSSPWPPSAPPPPSTPPSPILSSLLPSLSPRLLPLYHHLFSLASAANHATHLRPPTRTTNYRIPSNTYPVARTWTLLTPQGRSHQNNLVSTLYHLINLRMETPPAELLRLSLLAFASSLFMQWSGSRQRYAYVAGGLVDAILEMERRGGYGLPGEVMLWLYVMGSVSVFEEGERGKVRGGMRGVVEGLGLRGWGEMRGVLKGILWIDAMHDGVAEEVLVGVVWREWLLGRGEMN